MNKENTPLRCGGVEGLYSVKNNSFSSLCIRGSEAHLWYNSENNVSAFIFTYFIYIQTIIIIVSPRPLHS